MVKLIIPLKNNKNIKLRLATMMNQTQRQQLINAMLSDMLVALQQVAGVEVILLSSNPVAKVLARQFKLQLLPECSSAAGLNQSLQTSLNQLSKDEHHDVAVLHGDLPMIGSGEINYLIQRYNCQRYPIQGYRSQRFLRSTSPINTLLIAPDARQQGTNCMIFNTQAAPTLKYGTGSFLNHVKQAEARSLKLDIVQSQGLARDMDLPVDIQFLLNHGSSRVAERTRQFLISEGFAPKPPVARTPAVSVPVAAAKLSVVGVQV